jgi:hypothetical protein
MIRFKTLITALMIVITAAPAFAYSIYLKDGSRLIAREKFRIEDGRAIIVLQNGTQTFIDIAEIDIPRTEEANQSRYGTAFVIEDGKLIEAPVNKTEEKQSLTDVSRRSGAQARTRPNATRSSAATESAETEFQKTATGSVDLTVFPRAPYRNLEVSEETSRFLRALGVNEFQIFQGTDSRRAFLEMTANSESSVFRGLEAAADTLLHLQNQYADQIQALEILMLTSNRNRAGQFVLTSEKATELAEQSSDATTFFIENVQF